MTLQQLEYFLAAVEPPLVLGGRTSLAHGPAEPVGADPPARGRARLAAVHPRPPRPRADRGGPAAAAARRAHARRRAGGAATPCARCASWRPGTATFGTFGNAPYYLLSDLVQDFRARYPNVRVRLIGQNSSEVADAVRDGHLEAGLIVLPIDDRGLDIEPAIDDELLYLSADPERTREPMTIERLAEAPLILYDARFGWADPTRRQLAERAQRAGVTLEPEIEVEYVEAALDLAVRGLGDTIGTRRVALGRGFARRLHSVAFDPPVVDTFAFVTRRNAHLSPATRAFMELAAKRMEALGAAPTRIDVHDR